MAIRLSGLTSGMDTDAIVQEMVKAYSAKTEKYEKASTKLTWKQEAWKTLNTKIYGLYTSASNMRMSGAYNLRKVTVSDNTKATITANSDAVKGSQKLNILKTAQSGYITGGDLGDKVTTKTTLADLGYTGGNATINVKKNDGTTSHIKLTKDSTITDVVAGLKEAGLNASFDANNHRLFVSAKDSGVANDFAISGTGLDGEAAVKALGLDTALATTDKDGNTVFTASGKLYEDAYNSFYLKAKVALGKDNLSVDEVKQYINDQIYQYDELVKQNTALSGRYELSKGNYERAQSELASLEKKYEGVDTAARWAELQQQYGDGSTLTQAVSSAQAAYDAKAAAIATLEEELAALDPTDPDFTTNHEAKAAEIEAAKEELAELEAPLNEAKAAETEYKDLKRLQELPAEVETTKEAYETVKAERESIESQMSALGVSSILVERGAIKRNEDGTQMKDANGHFVYENEEIVNRAVYETAVRAVKGYEIMTDTVGIYKNGGATKVDASDAVIKLNGVEFTNSTNSFNINGLSINATAVTGDGDENAVQVTTTVDTQGIYDKIKDFLTEYNNVINELCKVYNAESAKDYEPLTDEEKEAMSDDQIEKWETKIKDALLRRDGTVNSIMSAMVNSMAQTFEINGEKVSLSTFGISTLGFLNAPKNEHYAFHIDGDEDDENTSGKKDKLMAAIEEDPDKVMEFMKQLTGKLYSAIDEKMKSTELSSAYKVYNDKEMDKELARYAETIQKWEDKVKDKEDYYYKQFSQMEVALSKLQNQTSSISGLLNM